MTMARSCVYYVFQMMLARKPVEASWPSISALQPLHCWKKVRKSANDLELHMPKRNLVWSVSNQQGFALIKHQCKMWWWGNRIGLPSKGKIVRIRLQWEDDRYSPAANSPHLMVRNQRIGSFETMMIQTLVGIVSLISFNLVRSRWCSMMFNDVQCIITRSRQSVEPVEHIPTGPPCQEATCSAKPGIRDEIQKTYEGLEQHALQVRRIKSSDLSFGVNKTDTIMEAVNIFILGIKPSEIIRMHSCCHLSENYMILHVIAPYPPQVWL